MQITLFWLYFPSKTAFATATTAIATAPLQITNWPLQRQSTAPLVAVATAILN